MIDLNLEPGLANSNCVKDLRFRRYRISIEKFLQAPEVGVFLLKRFLSNELNCVFLCRDVKVCADDLIAEKDLMDAQTLIVEEDCSLGSVDDQNVSDLSSPEALLDSTSTNADDDVDLQYQFRSNEGGVYQDIPTTVGFHKFKLISMSERTLKEVLFL